MTAYNVVRFKVKPGQEKAFLEAHGKMKPFDGMKEAAIIKTGDRSYCLIGKWQGMDEIIAARPGMIGTLDSFRGMLEDLGGGLGVTDPISGEVVVDLKAG